MGIPTRLWPEVIRAIEAAAPFYDEINDLVSLGKASRVRNDALSLSEINDRSRVLDSGTGPGSISVNLPTQPALLVGLDYSLPLLKMGRSRASRMALEPVRGAFENLPFRDGSFDRVLTSFALRDALDMERTVAEYRRVLVAKGRLAFVDLGKPDNRLKRFGVSLYVCHLMPLLARIALGGRVRGNPWRMIVPTFDLLPLNKSFREILSRFFTITTWREYLAGAVVLAIAERSS